MNAAPGRVQCPFCMAYRKVTVEGKIPKHSAGRRGVRKVCPGSGRTKEEAKAEQLAAKSEGRAPVVLSGPPEKVDAPSKQVEPEDIF